MVFMRSIMTLKLSTSIEIDMRTSGSKVYDFILHIYDFYGINIIFEYLGFCCDRFGEAKIYFMHPNDAGHNNEIIWGSQQLALEP